ncbi:hypothetical protein PCE1_000705 [Barthelona sp. PCE]
MVSFTGKLVLVLLFTHFYYSAAIDYGNDDYFTNGNPLWERAKEYGCTDERDWVCVEYDTGKFQNHFVDESFNEEEVSIRRFRRNTYEYADLFNPCIAEALGFDRVYAGKCCFELHGKQIHTFLCEGARRIV